MSDLKDQVASFSLDARVSINEEQVGRVAAVIQRMPEAKPFDGGFLVSEFFPPEDSPVALDFFFVATLQQFGFWQTREGRYHRPLIAAIDGRELKGSSYLYYAYARKAAQDAGFFTPEHQADLSEAEMLALFRADDGQDPMPIIGLHLKQARSYGTDMLALGLTPQAIIAECARASEPLKTFISFLDHIGGYQEDPLRKKNYLLALCLSKRPEAFLKPGNDETIPPIIDYHCMRFCLRTGILEVSDPELKQALGNRQLVSEADEWAVRYASYLAVEQLVVASGLSMGAVDNITFNYTRSHCPELTVPVCANCALSPVCRHQVELFQPVFRTTYY